MQLSLPFPVEEWRDIPGYEGRYQVSNTGFVRRTYYGRGGKTPKKKPIHGKKSKEGYLSATLHQSSVSKTYLIHRLVMLVFAGSSDLQVNHKNGIQSDNRLENLEYCTPAENIRHAIDVLGKNNVGSNHPQSTLTEVKVREIRRLYAEGMPASRLSGIYHTGEDNIYQIVHRYSWKHVVD